MKFKVGERYKVKDSDSNEYGNIIEITKAKYDVFGHRRVTYEIVENVSGVDTEKIGKSFDEISIFADNLVKVVRELPRKFYVKCKTEERVDNVLKKAEELGYKWNGGQAATEFREFEAPVIIFFDRDKTIIYGTFDCDTKSYEKVRYKDFIAYDDNRRYTGKIIFLNGDDEFKTGNICKVVDGKIQRDSLTVLPYIGYFETFEDVKNYFGGKCSERIGRWSTAELLVEEYNDEPVFDMNKKYIFDKLRYELDMEDDGRGWPEKCDGNVVDVKNPKSGRIGPFKIVPGWCKEVVE